MPSSIKDRFTVDWEPFFFFTKSQKYYFETQYEPLNEDTLRESRYTVNLTERKSQETRQGLNKWKPTKDYVGNNIQNPLSIKSRIVNKVYFGGKKYPGNVDNSTYSGNEWIPTNLELSEQDRKNAMSIGWDGVSDYAYWYFNDRKKKSWHNHEHDAEMGFGHQTKEKPRQIPYPYGRNKRCVWKISTKSFPGAHFATFPPELVETPIKACCPPNGIVLDPFMGRGTVALVALKLARNFVGIELNEEYIKMAETRIRPYLEQTKLTV